MPPAPQPLNEEERLQTLEAYKVSLSDSDDTFQAIVAVASQICATPIALISIVDRDCQWFLAQRGLEVQQTPREQAFCGYTILSDDILVVQDAQQDPRFCDNPLVVGEPHIRFYAGAPLIAPNGDELGSLCVIDSQPRTLSPEQLNSIQALSKVVVALLEARKIAAQLADSLSRTKTLSALIPICSYCRRVRTKDKDYWLAVEDFMTREVGGNLSHGICPECANKHFSEFK